MLSCNGMEWRSNSGAANNGTTTTLFCPIGRQNAAQPVAGISRAMSTNSADTLQDDLLLKLIHKELRRMIRLGKINERFTHKGISIFVWVTDTPEEIYQRWWKQYFGLPLNG